LAASEYFVFVDFKRERLNDTIECRGSLFSHQELAIASFLDLEVLAFQEAGVKQSDGIMGFLQANAISFTDRPLTAERYCRESAVAGVAYQLASRTRNTA